MTKRYASRQTDREYICGLARKSIEIEIDFLLVGSGVDVFDYIATVIK